MTAAEAMLIALTELTDAGQRPPCGYSSDEWLSEDSQQRATACHRCHDCQLLTLCEQYGHEIGASFGVFGGVDRTPHPRKAGHAST